MNFPLHHTVNYLYNHYLQRLDRFWGTTFSKPTFVILLLTRRCNSKCKMCQIAYKPFEEEMSTNQIKNLMLNLKGWLGPFIMKFDGGEPTLRKDVWELISFADSLKIRPMLTTNGTLITKKNIPLLIKSGLKDIKISLDSLNPETYKKIRGKNFHKRVLKTITLLKKHTKNIGISLSITITKHNVNELPELIEFTKQKKLNSIIFCPLISMHSNIKKELCHSWPDPKKVEFAINKVIKYKKKNYPISNSFKHLELIKKYYKNPDSINEKCMSHLLLLKISDAGYMHVCGKRIGNVLEKLPKEIWNSKENKQLLKRLSRCRKNCTMSTCRINDSLINRLKQFKRLNTFK